MDKFLKNAVEVDEIRYITKDINSEGEDEDKIITRKKSQRTIENILVSMQGNYVVIWYEDDGITLIPYHKILRIHTNLENKKNQKNR